MSTLRSGGIWFVSSTGSDSSINKREKEVESLTAIYPEECLYKGKEKGVITIQMYIPSVFGRTAYASATLLIRIPKNYTSIMSVLIFRVM